VAPKKIALAVGETGVSAVGPPWRIVDWVSGSVGSTSWRCMRGTIAIGRVASARHTTSVCSWAFAP
jgi:hypothetical protein